MIFVNTALQEELVCWSSLLLTCVFPALAMLLLVSGRRLRTGFYWLPLLVFLGWGTALFLRDRYEVPLAIAYAAAHPDPDAIVDYDPLNGNVALLFTGWLLPLLPCLFVILLVYLYRCFWRW